MGPLARGMLPKDPIKLHVDLVKVFLDTLDRLFTARALLIHKGLVALLGDHVDGHEGDQRCDAKGEAEERRPCLQSSAHSKEPGRTLFTPGAAHARLRRSARGQACAFSIRGRGCPWRSARGT